MDTPHLTRLPVPVSLHATAAAVHAGDLGDVQDLASRILAPEESAEFEALRHAGRRSEWLAARACLKILLCESGHALDPRRVRIRRDQRGRPSVCVAGGDPLGGDCSLAHAGPWAAAAWTARGDVRLGIDVECETPRLQRIRDLFVSTSDRAAVARPEPRQLTIWWCLKEACSKAVGLGLGVGLAGVECVETAAGCHRVGLSGGEPLAGWHHDCGPYVFALCARRLAATDRVAGPRPAKDTFSSGA